MRASRVSVAAVRNSVIIVALVIAVPAIATLASCSGPASPTATESSFAGPATTPSPVITPSPAKLPASPLTGLAETSPAPVLVVKLDNTRNAQPHAGLAYADIVYIEEVEYGITRLAAVFSSTIPQRIGPVRSARITDIDLLAQYGSPAFAYSGAQHKLLPKLADASFIDISPNKGASSYTRDFDRRAPYNYFLNGGIGLKRATDATHDHDMGFTFSQEPPIGGLPAEKVRVEWSYASAGFTYDEVSGLYRVQLNGKRARAEENDRGQNAATVVVQYVDQKPSEYFDEGGGNTPHAQTIGRGKAIILRDGRSWDVTWERPAADSGTTFTRADGSPMPFKPGQQWIVLLDRDRTAKISTRSTASASPSAESPPALMGSTSPSRR
jgi:hypothetical protein